MTMHLAIHLAIQVLLELMKIQKEILETKGRLNSKYANLLHSRFDGKPIPLKCKQCGTLIGETNNPAYSTNRPDHFVDLFKLTCRVCSWRTHSIPSDENVPVITPDILHCEGQVKKVEERYKIMIQQPENLTPQHGRTVEIWCIICQEDTILTQGGHIYTDKTPRWTLGSRRPLYVERRVDCQKCKANNKSSFRFIPKDSDNYNANSWESCGCVRFIRGEYDRYSDGSLAAVNSGIQEQCQNRSQ
jgi:hypothetical protein